MKRIKFLKVVQEESIRDIVFQRQNILKILRFRAKSRNHAKLDANRTSSYDKKFFIFDPKNLKTILKNEFEARS